MRLHQIITILNSYRYNLDSSQLSYWRQHTCIYQLIVFHNLCYLVDFVLNYLTVSIMNSPSTASESPPE